MLREKSVLSGLFGLAVGDALGVPVEFMSREMLDKSPVRKMLGYGSHNQPKGTWSDDTSMVLATMDAMCANIFSVGMCMDCFSKWLRQGIYTVDGTVFDVGGTTSQAIYRYIAGERLEDCGSVDERSNGNGSLMRMLPMIYYIMGKYGEAVNDRAVNEIYALSGLTHNHIISKVCCVYYVYIGIRIINQRHRRLPVEIANIIEDIDMYYEGSNPLPQIIGFDSLSESMDLQRNCIRSTGFVVDSLEASVWCLYNTESYREAVELAVNLGGDTDTIGAITGSLAGLYYGYEGIPAEWIEDLRGKEQLMAVAEKFYNRYR